MADVVNIIQKQEIEQRLQNGEKASHIALETGLSDGKIQKIAHRAGIKLKQGGQKVCDNPELYHQHIDNKYGPGTADKILLLRQYLPYDDICKELGINQRGSVHRIAKYLTGGERKPKILHKPGRWTRSDVTIEKVREGAERCLSVEAIARELNTSVEAVRLRAKASGITLPNGKLNLGVIQKDKRPDITKERIEFIINNFPSLYAGACYLKTNSVTIKRRAKRFGVPLSGFRTSKQTTLVA